MRREQLATSFSQRLKSVEGSQIGIMHIGKDSLEDFPPLGIRNVHNLLPDSKRPVIASNFHQLNVDSPSKKSAASRSQLDYLAGEGLVCPTRPWTGPSDKWLEDLAQQVVGPTCQWPMSNKWSSLPAQWVIEQAGSTTCRTAQIVPRSSGAVRQVVGPASRTPRADHMSDVPVRPIPTSRADTFNRSSGWTRCPTCPLVGQACPTSAGPTSVTCRTCRFDESNSSDLYTFNVTGSTAALDGFLRPVLAINGQIPGPLIQANEGDQLEITVINQMKAGLTIH
ncbi:hypothetical protein PCASD_01149 [Puccinia coronata f. sp. avenae]|uniref:Plastocyanin-like domain-containing protein n=1 Tax=Puccinia coronata f. sp. avenae TaxID=200324 RepID=A0A2N5VLN1_9BASI|nr:hypothetical protein PCASD_01149 [Puccinia coronata f. sp. avenae]